MNTMPRTSPSLLLFTVFLAFSLLVSCRSPQVTGEEITVTINADGDSRNVRVPAGNTVSQALGLAGVTIGELDQADPPPYTVLTNGDSIDLTRVEEIFETEEQIIPFE
ncbi:MAG: ubiquitin-like domain-containing protein [Anaerolineales bacterium]